MKWAGFCEISSEKNDLNMEYYVGKLSDLFRSVFGADAVVG